jgi:hypothetical protein
MLFILLINLNYYGVINNKFNYFLGFHNQGTHLLSENNFLRNVLSILPLLSAQVLEKLCIG